MIRRRRAITIGAAILLILLYFFDQRGWLLSRRNDDLATYHGVSTAIIRVIDGDTVEVDAPDALAERSSTRVRLWGVNAPEPASGNRLAEPFANDAAELLSQRANSVRVILWLEAHQTRDTFGALLAHVELPDGARLNEELLEAGLAKTDERWPHAMLTRYSQLENGARRQGLGLWRKAVAR